MTQADTRGLVLAPIVHLHPHTTHHTQRHTNQTKIIRYMIKGGGELYFENTGKIQTYQML